MALRGLIFDFDGVIADREVLANTGLAEFLSRLGFLTTLDVALERYMGKRRSDMIDAIEREIGQRLPNEFSDDLHIVTLERFQNCAGLRVQANFSEATQGWRDVSVFARVPMCDRDIPISCVLRGRHTLARRGRMWRP